MLLWAMNLVTKTNGKSFVFHKNLDISLKKKKIHNKHKN